MKAQMFRKENLALSRHPRSGLATDGTISDNCVVPRCYHVSTSSPEETARDIKACVMVGARAGPKHRQGRRRKVHSLVYYRERADADTYLDQITECLRSKGHVVHLAEVLQEIDDYPNESEEST